MSSLRRHRNARFAFTLIETLIASAIVALTATSVYYAFLRMNQFAVAARADTAAKIVLERAVNLAMTTEWQTNNPPPILTDTKGAFLTFNPDTGADSNGAVSLFSDPMNNTVINATISRQVTPFVDPKGVDLGLIYQVTFKLDYKVGKRATEPLTSVYAYTIRACDK